MKVPTNIWDLAIEQSKEKRANELTDQKSSDERTLLILGSRGVGKTTLVHRFLGVKYLGFFSSHSLKLREKYISFVQLVLLSLYIF